MWIVILRGPGEESIGISGMPTASVAAFSPSVSAWVRPLLKRVAGV